MEYAAGLIMFIAFFFALQYEQRKREERARVAQWKAERGWGSPEGPAKKYTPFGGRFVILLLVAVGVFFTAIFIIAPEVVTTTPSSNPGLITQEEFGEEWPFTVPEGVLGCDGAGITFTANRKTYALNGPAMGKGYPKIDEIWLYDQAIADEWDKMFPGEKMKHPVRVPVSGVLGRGMELCGLK